MFTLVIHQMFPTAAWTLIYQVCFCLSSWSFNNIVYRTLYQTKRIRLCSLKTWWSTDTASSTRHQIEDPVPKLCFVIWHNDTCNPVLIQPIFIAFCEKYFRQLDHSIVFTEDSNLVLQCHSTTNWNYNICQAWTQRMANPITRTIFHTWVECIYNGQ